MEKYFNKIKQFYDCQRLESSPLIEAKGGFYKLVRDRIKGDDYFNSIMQETRFLDSLYDVVAKDLTRSKPVKNIKEYRKQCIQVSTDQTSTKSGKKRKRKLGNRSISRVFTNPQLYLNKSKNSVAQIRKIMNNGTSDQLLMASRKSSGAYGNSEQDIHSYLPSHLTSQMQSLEDPKKFDVKRMVIRKTGSIDKLDQSLRVSQKSQNIDSQRSISENSDRNLKFDKIKKLCEYKLFDQ